MKVLAALFLSLPAILFCQSDIGPKAWHPSLPNDGVIAASRIGQGKVTRQLFNDCWTVFRTQYYVDTKGAFVAHRRSQRLFSFTEKRIYNSRTWMSNPELTEFIVVGNSDAEGRAIDGFYMVALARDKRLANRNVDARFQAPAETIVGRTRFYVADPSQIRRGQFTAEYDDPMGNGNYISSTVREYAPMPDTKTLQDAFLDSIKAGSRFQIVLYRHTVCPYHTQSTYSPGGCTLCNGKGGAEFPHLLTLVW